MRLRLEKEFGGQFVAIEPESQDFFVGQSFDSAVAVARTEYPNQVTYTVRIGHQAALSYRAYGATKGHLATRHGSPRRVTCW